MLPNLVSPRPAATLILARDAHDGPEVLMMRRSTKADFIAGAYVFPGGGLDRQDLSEESIALCAGDAADEQLPFKICAIRECFEEAGILLARGANDMIVEIEGDAAVADYAGLRQRMNAGQISFAALCRERNLLPAIDQIAYLSHWITPLGAPKRFDTRYFVALAPQKQSPSHDEAETIAHVWARPANALARHRRGEIELVFPTIKTLEALACFDTVAALLDHARQPRVVMPIQPRLAKGRGGVRVIGPDDYAFAEVGKLDPDGQICASYEILPGVPVRLSANVRRITAPNASFMTGPGTNTYLLGAGDEIAVIDPGPASASHVQILLEEARGRICWILVTHTHPDHSPAAALLKEKTGAQLWGVAPLEGSAGDPSFQPDRLLVHGERVTLAGCSLRILRTPGHASNHLCYLLEEEHLLFTGDHIMQGSTVIIAPPDGDMAAYLTSLRALLQEDISFLAPAHGFLMDQPREAVERLLLHRLERENKIYNALCELGEASVQELLPLAYDDVPVRIHRFSARSLQAHLIKLEAEERACHEGGRWRPL